MEIFKKGENEQKNFTAIFFPWKKRSSSPQKKKSKLWLPVFFAFLLFISFILVSFLGAINMVYTQPEVPIENMKEALSTLEQVQDLGLARLGAYEELSWVFLKVFAFLFLFSLFAVFFWPKIFPQGRAFWDLSKKVWLSAKSSLPEKLEKVFQSFRNLFSKK